jgi:hypothetical protein
MVRSLLRVGLGTSLDNGWAQAQAGHMTTTSGSVPSRTQSSSATPIPVRITALGDCTDEITEAIARGGLRVLFEAGSWYASQGELDTPHVTFRLSPL